VRPSGPLFARAFAGLADDDGVRDGDDDSDVDEDEVQALAQAMEHEWDTYDSGGGSAHGGAAAVDLGTGRDDRPGFFTGLGTAADEAAENFDRPADHVWRGAAPHWPPPAAPGGIGPRDPVLEQRLYATGQRSEGINFAKYNDLPVTVSGDRPIPPVTAVCCRQPPLSLSHVAPASACALPPTLGYLPPRRPGSCACACACA
jgi:hypothetical protein